MYADFDSTSPTNEYGDPRVATNPKILIIGHGRHGKDTVAEMLRDSFGFKFVSSSEFVGREVLWNNWGCAVYPNFDAMFEDRSNHRTLWAQMISAYNTPDKTNTAATMLCRGYDLYVGMRMRDELDACKAAGVFDHIVWVDRSDHLPDEPEGSMNLKATDADYRIDNNGSLEDLVTAVNQCSLDLGFAK
jgi:hypothetical protein